MKARVKKAKAASKRPSSKRPSPKRPSAKRPAGRGPAPRPVAGRAARRPTSNVRPLHDRVLIRRIEEAEQAVGGIIIPDTAKEKPLQAEVIAVGSGRVLDSGKKVALTLQPGDKVLIGKWSGTEVKIDDEELLILKEDEVLGILS